MYEFYTDLPDLGLFALQQRFRTKELEDLYIRYEQRSLIGENFFIAIRIEPRPSYYNPNHTTTRLFAITYNYGIFQASLYDKNKTSCFD